MRRARERGSYTDLRRLMIGAHLRTSAAMKAFVSSGRAAGRQRVEQISRPTPGTSSRPATSAHSAGVRTAWSSGSVRPRWIPQVIRQCVDLVDALPSCSSTRSMSERGPSSRRARLPTAARAAPLAGPPTSRHTSSTSADSTHSVIKRRRSGPAVDDHPDRIATLRRSLVRSRFRARPARALRFARGRLSSTGTDQTLPSPMRPVRALLTRTSMMSLASSSSTSTSSLTLGTRSTVYSAPGKPRCGPADVRSRLPR